ncbi:MAG: hypothetical protein AAFX94_07100 [Myxococcota bacterium]
MSAAAFAGSPSKSRVRSPERAIERQVVRPLNAAFERRFMFSRARVMPPRRKVETFAALSDREGREYVRYEVRTVKGKRVQQTLTGCYYPNENAVFVASEHGFVPANQHPLLARGKKSKTKKLEYTVEASRCVENSNQVVSMTGSF